MSRSFALGGSATAPAALSSRGSVPRASRPRCPAVARRRVGRSAFPVSVRADAVNEASIKVIGCGGGGGNAVNRMINSGLRGVEFWSLNTDAQALVQSQAPNRLQIGKDVTRGLGTGGNAELGAAAAEESRDAIAKAVRGADLCFITAGMGGGTGSGSAPVVAELAKQAGCLTVGIVTKPFSFEGRRRLAGRAGGHRGAAPERRHLIVIPNDRCWTSWRTTRRCRRRFCSPTTC